ncbi:major paralogous domain-containing protein/Por secretion system C-terminal sorting domain-containing protein [Chryseobacterium taichungense]|uniref:Major paralogous domain-containing protein/Por secretion system C-terminal sorting domain-containing protein n=1 Tax=Chryseobacterium taichungense TaxID=295069 RepID=A0A1H8B068_9FLAO|nr:T9SS type A sorting domain-containing protein [Chryseobacterium taichungense]SEM75554.1 major paralogous domain-containing protein/Por secretion system C-terminal sorting domain-containing protein [Chryseobacterium taichungense]
MFGKIYFKMRKISIGLLSVLSICSYAQQWEDVGGVQTVSAAGSSFNNLAIKDGKYYISYYDTSVMKGSAQVFNGNSWSYVGGSPGITNSYATYNSLSLAPNGNIYYTNQGSGLEVRQFDGTSWTQLPSATTSAINYHASAVSSSNILFTYSTDNSGTVRRYINGTWEQVGNAGFSNGATFAEMVIGTNNKVYTCNVSGGVKVYENTTAATSSDNWALVGGGMVDAASSSEQYNSDIAIDTNNNLYVAYVSNSASGQKLNVKKFNGNTWTQLGNANFSSGKVQHVAIAVSPSGNSYVVASRWENDDYLRNTVYQLNNSSQTWETLGGSFVSDGQATYNDLAFDNLNNDLVLVYSQNGAKVKRFSLNQSCNNTDPGTNTGDLGCVTFTYNGQNVTYTTVRGADGKIWLQQNLGSSRVATSLDDTESYGDLFQWGRWDDGHQLRNSATVSAPSANSPDGLSGIISFILGSGSASWWATNATSDAWNAAAISEITSAVGVDPCKAVGQGWRLPTSTEWATLVGTEGISNPTTAYASYLKLPAAGYRSNSSGGFTYVGARGYYWSSDTANSGGKYLYIGSSIANAGSGGPRGQGESIRCIKDFSGLATSDIRLTVNSAEVYPNPTKGIVSIKSDSSIEAVKIINSVGQNINVPFSQNQIDMHGLPNGMYIIEFKLKNRQSVTKKIIKN